MVIIMKQGVLKCLFFDDFHFKDNISLCLNCAIKLYSIQFILFIFLNSEGMVGSNPAIDLLPIQGE